MLLEEESALLEVDACDTTDRAFTFILPTVALLLELLPTVLPLKLVLPDETNSDVEILGLLLVGDAATVVKLLLATGDGVVTACNGAGLLIGAGKTIAVTTGATTVVADAEGKLFPLLNELPDAESWMLPVFEIKLAAPVALIIEPTT